MDIYEFLEREDYSKKVKELDEALSKIEKKYIEFFKSRPSKFELEEHDRLHNYWFMTCNNQLVRFGVDKNSDIPEYIKTECDQAFIRIFGTDNK